MVDLEPHLRAITQEAKRLRHTLPSGHPIEVHDLVSAGVAHSLEFLRFEGTPSPALVRANAREGMLAEVRRWDHGTKEHPVSASQFDDFDSTWCPRRCTPPLPIELMIDLLRALLTLRMAEALPFVSHVLHDDDHEVAARELRMAPCSMKNRIAAARCHLQEALVEYEPKPAKTAHQRAVELFRRGESCASVARTLHISEAKTAQIQDEIDPLAKRRRVAQAKAMRTERVDVKTADIIQLRRSGMTEQAIGDKLGCSQKLVNKRLHKLGIHEGRVDSRRKRGLRPVAEAHPRTEATRKRKPGLDWKDIGTADAAQDAIQSTPFAHVGGLDKRNCLVAPWWTAGHEEDYLEGYREAALQMYGHDWRTCSNDRASTSIPAMGVVAG